MLFSISVIRIKVNTSCANFFMCYNKSMSKTYSYEERVTE